MITYKVMDKEDITLNDLDDFTRDQHTVRVKTVEYNDDGTLKSKELKELDIEFDDLWDLEKRRGSDSLMPTAFITGVTGQDGSYLAEFLIQKGYNVIGMVRRTSTVNFHRIAHIQDNLTLVPGDLLDEISLIHILEEHRPD